MKGLNWVPYGWKATFVLGIHWYNMGGRLSDPTNFRTTSAQHFGYFRTGLCKIEAARAVATHFDPDRNSSRSFAVFLDAVSEAAAGR